MKTLFGELLTALEQEQAAVLVTIIASSGSTPRGTGSRMLVKEDTSFIGTVGGGAVEYQSQCTALTALKEKTSCVTRYILTKNQVADIGMACGGNVVVYFQYIKSGDPQMKALCRQVLEALDRDEDSWLIMDVTEETVWSMGLYSRSAGMEGGLGAEASGLIPQLKNKAAQAEAGGRKYYCEPLVQSGKVYIFGGGHVAQELVPVLNHVGFRCVVYDDREEFANPRVFPQAWETIVGNLEDVSGRITVRPQDYVCIMTRGHLFDYYVQKQMLIAKPCYIGVIGSRNKIHVITGKLLADGFTKEEIEFCHMPIGTSIGAETPEEIAISIAGELISIRAGRAGRRVR